MKKLVWYYPHLKFMMGGTKFILETAKELNKDYDITVLCNLGNKDIINLFKKNGIKVRTYFPLSTNSIFYWALFPFFLTLELLMAFKYLSKADVIVATLFPSNVVCALYSLIRKKKYYYYCYEPFPFFHSREFKKTFSPLGQFLLAILTIFYSWIDIWATRRASKIFTLNYVTKKLIKKTYSKDAIVTLMGVDTAHFMQHRQNEIKKKFAGRIIISHSTDYTFMKRTDLALKITAHLVKKYPAIVLIITSTQPNSPNKKKYEELANNLGIEKNVHFAGLVPYDDLPLYYGASVCYLSCSYDETLGTTSSNLPVKEALACAVPSIRANITKEDVEDGVSGFLVDPRNTSEVAQKIEFLIENQSKAKVMGKTGRKKMLNLYKWQNVASIINHELQN